VINFAPNNAEAYLNRGLAHYRLGDYRAAIADNNQAIRLKHYDFRAYYNRGVASAGVGNYSDAITDYNRALSAIPQHLLPLLADIYNNRGLARFELADIEAAMLDFKMAIRLNANDYRAYFNRGCACTRSGDDLGAVRDFTESLRLNPSNGQAYFNRGIAFYRLGYEQAAIWDLQKAFPMPLIPRRDPDFLIPHSQSSRVF
jgi:tetratricopeptide (TPR) repeat protein